MLSTHYRFFATAGSFGLGFVRKEVNQKRRGLNFSTISKVSNFSLFQKFICFFYTNEVLFMVLMIGVSKICTYLTALATIF